MRRSDEIIVEDHSTYGTFLNDRRVNGRAPLKPRATGCGRHSRLRAAVLDWRGRGHGPPEEPQFDTFSLSFLDCMSCGFGAVVLFFMIISATMTVRQDELNKKLSERADSLKVEVLEGAEPLVELRNRLDEQGEGGGASGLSRRIIEQIEQKRVELRAGQGHDSGQEDHINRLKADLKTARGEPTGGCRPPPAEPEDPADRLSFVGEGNRQYLTGLKVGGRRIFILVDASASMLDENIVNVIRRRNMPDAQKIRAPKWQRALRTVEWVVAQFEPTTKFQIESFNEPGASRCCRRPMASGSTEDPRGARVGRGALTGVVPQNGTNLHHGFAAMPAHEPAARQRDPAGRWPPDPGRGLRAVRDTGSQRVRNFNQAVGKLAGQRAGQRDPVSHGRRRRAASAYWRARPADERGSFMSPPGTGREEAPR